MGTSYCYSLLLGHCYELCLIVKHVNRLRQTRNDSKTGTRMNKAPWYPRNPLSQEHLSSLVNSSSRKTESSASVLKIISAPSYNLRAHPEKLLFRDTYHHDVFALKCFMKTVSRVWVNEYAQFIHEGENVPMCYAHSLKRISPCAFLFYEWCPNWQQTHCMQIVNSF